MSACVTDVCPTGALTTREFRFESRVWNLDSAESVCNGCDVGCNIFIGQRNGQIFRYRPRVNPEVNDHWLCDYGRFSHERYETDRIVVPKVRRDDYLGISTWSEALEIIEEQVEKTTGDKIAVIASAQMTNEEAFLVKRLFIDELGAATVDVMVDPIGPIRMKSRNGWIVGAQAAPNFRGVRHVGVGANTSRTVEQLMTEGAEGIDILYVCEAGFSERASEPDVIANLRKARTLVVHAWENHPLAEVADVVLPSTIFAEKEGTFTNLQGRIQRIHQSYPPKGQAQSDLEILRRLGFRLFPDIEDFRSADVETVFDRLSENVAAFRGIQWNEDGSGIFATSGTT
jgi:NADH-quinone oxidoreductase subunit G